MNTVCVCVCVEHRVRVCVVCVCVRGCKGQTIASTTVTHHKQHKVTCPAILLVEIKTSAILCYLGHLRMQKITRHFNSKQRTASTFLRVPLLRDSYGPIPHFVVRSTQLKSWAVKDMVVAHKQLFLIVSPEVVLSESQGCGESQLWRTVVVARWRVFKFSCSRLGSQVKRDIWKAVAAWHSNWVLW